MVPGTPTPDDLTSLDPLALDPDTMRTMGYRVVDMLVERMTSLAAEPVLRMATRAEMEARIAEPPPEQGRNFESLVDCAARDFTRAFCGSVSLRE